MIGKNMQGLVKSLYSIGKVETYINEAIKERGSALFVLHDPPKLYGYNIKPEQVAKLAYEALQGGAIANMLGGSTKMTSEIINSYARAIKKEFKEKGVYSPVIGFPVGMGSIGKELDALWYMSCLNSSDVAYLVGLQTQAAPIIKDYKIEPIPMGYIIVYPGGTAGNVASAKLIPRDKPDLAMGYALAAQYLGFRFVYLEAGSGVEEHVPNEMVYEVRKAINIPLGVGGGIKSSELAKEKVANGADFIFIGTKIEELILNSPEKVKESVEEIVEAMKEGVKTRKH